MAVPGQAYIDKRAERTGMPQNRIFKQVKVAAVAK